MSSQSLLSNILNIQAKSLTTEGSVTAGSINSSGSINYSGLQAGYSSITVAGASASKVINVANVRPQSQAIACLASPVTGGVADPALLYISRVICGAGTITVTGNAAPTTHDMYINYLITNF